VTPAEQEKAAARAAVAARMADGTVILDDADAKHMTGAEIVEYVNLGRFGPTVGADKRLARR